MSSAELAEAIRNLEVYLNLAMEEGTYKDILEAALAHPDSGFVRENCQFPDDTRAYFQLSPETVAATDDGPEVRGTTYSVNGLLWFLHPDDAFGPQLPSTAQETQWLVTDWEEFLYLNNATKLVGGRGVVRGASESVIPDC